MLDLPLELLGAEDLRGLRSAGDGGRGAESREAGGTLARLPEKLGCLGKSPGLRTSVVRSVEEFVDKVR